MVGIIGLNKMIELLESRYLAAVCDVNGDSMCDSTDILEVLHYGTWYWGAGSEGPDINGDSQFNYGDVDAIWAAVGVEKGDINADGLINADDYAVAFKEFPELNLRATMEFYKGGEPFSDDWVKWEEAQSRYQNYDVPLDYLLGVIGVDIMEMRGEDARNPAAQAFSYNDGDVNLDGVFNSTDFIVLGQAGGISDVDTSEIVRIFQIGKYI